MYTRSDNAAFANFVAEVSRTNSNWFEFVRLIAATKFCRSENDFHKINRVTQGELLRRLVPATCRSGSALVKTSVERPFNLRSDFVNVWRKARLEGYIYLWLMYASASIVYSDLSDDLMFVSRSCLAFSIIPQLIQTRRCHCLRLKEVLKFQASSCSAGYGPFSRCYWITVWMAPDHQARWQYSLSLSLLNTCKV